MLVPTLTLVVIIIAIALIFDYINGFHDAANSVATIVATRVLTPFQAVLWAAFFNFISAFTFGTGVARTVGQGLVNLDYVDPLVILAGLIGAIVWDLVTWWYGLPTSSSHALFGGYAGAAMANAVFMKGPGAVMAPLIWEGWAKTLAFMIVAPLLGLAFAYLLMMIVYWGFQGFSPKKMDVFFRKAQLFSAAVYSFAHGTNDAQKTMGIITGVLVTGGILQDFVVPVWVVLSAHAAIALGTMTGGWRIVHTMGSRITRLKPRSGFSAETAGAASILLATFMHVGVSTTHVITGAIAGVGSIRRPRAVRWRIATKIAWAWVLTIPASALVAAVTMAVLEMLRE
jgi:inorganic phosphate transporter, PiT family